MATSSTQQTRSASEHYAAQAALAAALVQQVTAAWNALLDVARLGRTVPVLSAAVAALVHQYGSASAAVAADYYDAARAAAAVRGSYVVVPAQPAGPDQVDEAVRWATRNLWRPDPAVEPARVMTQGAAQKLVLDTGRDTITAAALNDRQARGWARHTEPGCCYFCAMLATRGEVYRSRESASFSAHDHDRCQPEPVFGIYEPPAQVREWQALWRSSTRGTSGQGSVRAFRQAFESPAQGEPTAPHGG